MRKQHSKSPKHRRGRPVKVSKNEGGPERRVEVDRVLRTCAQAWQNGHGCILGKHTDEPG